LLACCCHECLDRRAWGNVQETDFISSSSSPFRDSINEIDLSRAGFVMMIENELIRKSNFFLFRVCAWLLQQH